MHFQKHHINGITGTLGNTVRVSGTSPALKLSPPWLESEPFRRQKNRPLSNFERVSKPDQIAFNIVCQRKTKPKLRYVTAAFRNENLNAEKKGPKVQLRRNVKAIHRKPINFS